MTSSLFLICLEYAAYTYIGSESTFVAADIEDHSNATWTKYHWKTPCLTYLYGTNFSGPCLLHQLSHRAVQNCFNSRHRAIQPHSATETNRATAKRVILFVGDSTIRQLYQEITYHITGNDTYRHYSKFLGFRHPVDSIACEVSHLLSDNTKTIHNTNKYCSAKNVSEVQDKCPIFIIVNFMLHGMSTVEKYTKNVRPFIRLLNYTTSLGPIVVWKQTNEYMGSGPAKKEMPDLKAGNRKLAQYNEAVEKLIRGMDNDKFVIWNNTAQIVKSFDKALGQGRVENTLNGPHVHFPPAVMEPQASLLLNYVCNDYLQANAVQYYNQLCKF